MDSNSSGATASTPVNICDDQLRHNLEREVDHLSALHMSTAARLNLQSEDAEDTLQDMFLASLEAIESGKASGINNRSAWSQRVGCNACLGILRTRRRRNILPLPDSIASAKSMSPEEALMRDELMATLLSAISRMPKKYREVITLRYLDEMTSEEAAKVLKITAGAVSGLLRSARQLLRNSLAHFVENE